MLKEFKYKDIVVVLKTNVLFESKCYFGETPIMGEIERAYRQTTYSRSPDMSDEIFVMSIYDKLVEVNIKPEKVCFGELTHTGTKMTRKEQNDRE